MELFGRPAIMKMLGRRDLHRHLFTARALEPFDGAPGRAHYIRAIVTQEGDELVARSTGKQDSNILTSMSRANALLIIDENTRRVEAGGIVKGFMLDES
jgi:molybdopterin molybdotransferase